MDLDDRIDSVESRVKGLERQVQRYRLMAVGLALVLTGIVLVGATGDKDAEFDTVVAREIRVVDGIDRVVVALGSDKYGGVLSVIGALIVANKTGKDGVYVFAGVDGGQLSVVNKTGKPVVRAYVDENGSGVSSVLNNTGNSVVRAYVDENGSGVSSVLNNKGKTFVQASAGENGGFWAVLNKTGEEVVRAYADEYGNGVVGAYNRKGRGRTLQPGP